ncbi:A disintegrin and metalloproteinase with thrombospondin motifs 7 [Chanos chanos]|uniref:A disintegrin and metalloproteinase with thrombospondin motifs 7 n=1 Tax=Chanos chanos TaxID=29144 RepID=A0A6J2ULV8_CHACN|nr:A disintegrin and metalloproteinase with thrombospondin motifs 7-like [Chanos chanos]
MLIHMDKEARVFGQAVFSLHVLFIAGVLSVIGNAKTNGLVQETETVLQELLQYEVVHPHRVDSTGRFLSNFVSHRVSRIQRRAASLDSGNLARVFYHLQYGGQDLHFNLTLNPYLLAPGFLTERRYGGLRGSTLHAHDRSLCYFLGEVWSKSTMKGQAAVSTCDGLTGLFKLSGEEFFIRPLEQSQGEVAPQAHAIYKRHASHVHSPLVQPLHVAQAANGTCGVKGASVKWERQRERWERRQNRRRIRQRSVSREKWVETLVVADPKMVEYHGSKGVESYVLAVMNIVAGLYQDPSIGNAINIVVVRLILLEQDEEDLKITHHADNSLNSFCKWQKQLNMKGDEHPTHHDVAVLLTRKDICAAINKPCETLGLSHVAGMCQPHRSCSISEDTGLPLAFTVAHELGHNFGIQHDGSGNDCEPVGKRPFVMSPQLLYGTSPPSWSRCSRQYITRFLDRGWGWCLDDPPVRNELTQLSLPPGVLYTAAHQCQLQYGSSSVLCDDIDNICSTLWCTVENRCHSKLDGAVDGTKCGEEKWCFQGECVPVGYRPEAVNGGWAPWSEWSVCTRTCGAGVQNAQRDCINPVPKFGGKYCVGERRRYRICNTNPCPLDQPTFRHIQCSQFNTMPYKGKFYKWVHVNNRVNPCELHCRPVNEYFSEKLLDAVIDGTQCYEGTLSRDMCVNGICKSIGCDYKIDSDAVEDRCGVCHGNGSTCETVKKTFERSEGLGYVDIGLIPEGARDIRIEEVAEAENFLALRSNDPEKYFLNGGWTIQWNGDYKAAGTVFTYERTGHLENLTSPGPTREPVWIQLLFQETNPGVRYEYTISRDTHLDNIPVSEFQWIYGSWTECSATCGTGVQRQIVHCVERTTGIVEEHYCDPATRPDDKSASCNENLCPAVWWVGEWQKCSSSCGNSGLTKRTVLCIQGVGLEEQQALEHSECQHLPRPESVTPCNTHVLCPADWTTGNWSECSVTCGTGLQRREVICTWNTGADCDPQNKPNSTLECHVEDCPTNDVFGNDWSGSGSSSKEIFNEINSLPHDNHLLKFNIGPTRAQPSSNDDLNNFIYGDFTYHNHIEDPSDNSIKNNVEVDDFYYDYNFIKFHEDLSYDPDEDGRVLSDNSGANPKQEPKPSPTTTENTYWKGSDVSVATSLIPTSASEIQLNANTLSYNTNYEDLKDPKSEVSIDENDFATDWPDENASENEDVNFPDDYFLLVSTTETPSSMTRFFQRLKESNVDPYSTQSHNVIHNQSPTDEERFKDQHTTSHVTLPDGLVTQESTVDLSEADSTNYDFYEKAYKMYEDATEMPLGHRHYYEVFSEDYFGERKREEKEIDVGEDVLWSESEWEVLSPQESTVSPTAFNAFDSEAHKDMETTQPQWLETSPWTPLSTANTEGQNLDQYVGTKFSSHDGHHESSLPVNDNIVTLGSLSQEPTPSPVPYNSAEENRGITSATEIEPLPPADVYGDLQSSLPSSEEIPAATANPKIKRRPPSIIAPAEPTGPGLPQFSGIPARSLATPPSWTEIDYNEIIIPSVLKSSGTESAPTGQPSQDTRIKASIHSIAIMMPTEPAPSPDFQPTNKIAAFWSTGNWSTCSTSCGFGAVWRLVTCSSGNDSDCDISTRPVPARRCYLRPCSAWRVGEWSKCSQNCGGGIKVREVQCYDMRDKRPLRPFHCQATSARPPAQLSCNTQLCLDWYTSSWGECSELCEGGEQQRLVTCPEPDRCNESLQPSHIQTCNNQACAQWVTGSWGQCSASCGGGVQRRLVKCVNTKIEEEVEHSQCDHEPWPDNTQKCNLQDCDSTPSDQVCLHNRLTLRFCQTLQWLGRCHLPTVRAQCCKTCGQHSRGNDRTARR